MFFQKRTVDLSQIKPRTVVTVETEGEENFDINFDEEHRAFVSCRMTETKVEILYSDILRDPRQRYDVQAMNDDLVTGSKLALGNRLMIQPRSPGKKPHFSPAVTRVLLTGQTVMGHSCYEAQNLSAVGLFLVIIGFAAGLLGACELAMEDYYGPRILVAAGLLMLTSGLALIAKHRWAWRKSNLGLS